MRLHCTSCTCSVLWEVVSYHVMRVGEIALGTFLGGAALTWVIYGVLRVNL